MKRTAILIFFYCGISYAEESSFCNMHAMDGLIIDEILTFEDLPYIITEENNPEFVPLAEAIQYTTKKYNKCDIGCADLAWHNAYVMAERKFWDQVEFTNGEIGMDGCGGNVMCKHPVRSHNVQCTVEVGDCSLYGISNDSPYISFKIKKVYQLECLGDLSCKEEGRLIDDCCSVVSFN